MALMCARSSSRCAPLGHDSVASRATHEVVVTAAGGRALLAALLLAWGASAHAAQSPEGPEASTARAEDTAPLAWLKSGNYQALEQYYSRQQSDYETGNESDQDLYRSFRRLYEDSLDNAGYFDRWVEAFPKSYAALLARGVYQYRMAWSVRGDKYLRDISTAQIDSMKNWLQRARPDLVASLQLTEKPYLSALYLLNVATLQGSAAERQHWYTVGTTIDPANTLVRYRYMFSLRPRWGGSYEQMEEFRQQCEERHLPRPLLARLDLVIHADRAEDAMWAGDTGKTFDEWAEVLRLADLAGESPSTEALIGYTRAAQDLNRPADAERGINMLADRKPTDAWSLARLGWIYTRAHRDADAWPLLLKAADQNDSWAQFIVGKEMYHGEPTLHMVADQAAGLVWIRRSADNCYPDAAGFLAEHGQPRASGCKRRSSGLGWAELVRAAAGPALVSLILGWMGATRRRARLPAEAGRLQHPVSRLIVGLFGFALFAGLALLSFVMDNGTAGPLVTGTLLGFAALSLLLVADYYRARFELTAEGMSYGRLFGAAGSLRWRDVTHLTYSRAMKWYRIETSSGEVVRVSAMLIGLPEFARAALAQVPSYALDEAAVAMLRSTAQGELPKLA
jgi:hypothetical protein